MTATGTESTDASSDLNLKIIWSLARWVEDVHGAKVLRRLAEGAGLDAENFSGATHWASLGQVERFLAAVRELVEDDDAFVRACAHRFEEGYGPVRYMVFALSERQFFELASKASKMMTRISHFETLAATRSTFHVRYHATRAESRLMCLSRHAAWAYGPTMWKMPVAQLEELACVSRGDPFCEYKLRWYDRRRLLPIFGASLAGGLAATALAAAHVTPNTYVTLPLLGALAGWIYELRRIQSANLALAQQQNQVLRDVGLAEAEARSEITALHQRQREWAKLVEQQVADRTHAVQQVVAELEGLQETRVTSLRGVSHDIRNPMSVVKGNIEFIRENLRDDKSREAIDDVVSAIDQIDGLVHRMMETLSSPSAVTATPRRLDVAPMAETLRRRLRALVFGRDVKITVFKTREAPDVVEVDPLILDRITDNLITNAAKYTERGSILLEITGTPALPDDEPTHDGYLTFKISDTGRGIQPDEVARAFRPRPVEEHAPSNSWGIGLSSAVRLLAQVGGRLDVMSKPGVGTTFWAHFPVTAIKPRRGTANDADIESMITRVVTIRRAEGT